MDDFIAAYDVLFLLVPLFSVGLGLLVVELSKKRWSDTPSRLRMILGACLLLVGGCPTISLLRSPGLNERRAMVRTVRNLRDETVQSVLIHPYPNEAYRQLVTSPRTITDPAFASQLSELLSGARRFRPNHPGARWNCIVEVITANKALSFGVSSTSNNGDLIEFTTGGGYDGWVIENLRCDGIGKLLEHWLLPQPQQKSGS